MKNFSVAVDGPSGAGKSTISKEISKRMGILYVDTGAIYRAIGLFVLEQGFDSKDEAGVNKCLDRIDVKPVFDNGVQHILLNGRDVTEHIRTPEVSRYASDVSAFGVVRDYLLELQRSLARDGSVIMDGRDIGTVVLPDADVKIFLSALPEVRARRRFLELVENGTDVSYEEVLTATVERDYNDSTRKIAPLRRADDAIMVDTTGLRLEESIDLIEKVIRKRIKTCFSK